MQIKSMTFCTFLCLLTLSLFAQKKDSIFTKTELQKATVYYGSGCNLNHLTKINVKQGVQVIVLDNVATELDLNTLQFTCPEQVTILSYTHRIYEAPLSDKSQPLIKKWSDSIKTISKEFEKNNRQASIIENAIRNISDLINNNFTTPDKKNISSEELIKLTNFYTDKIVGLKEKTNLLLEQRNIMSEKIAELRDKIAQLEQDAQNERGKKTGQLILQLMSSATLTIPIECSYFTQYGGWIPSYEIRVKSSDNSMRLAYKAMVSQHTGLDWNDVKLTLCTGSPILNNYIPELWPTYLQMYVPVLYNRTMAAPAVAKESMMSSMPDMTYEKKDEDSYALKMNTNADVSGYVKQQENALNLCYEINLPYDIPSDEKAYSIHIKEEKLQAGYEHIAIPKLDGDPFFSAKIGNWGNLNILPGETNIILDNMYIGKSYLNPNTPDDSMRISLGRDQSIAISRKEVKDFSMIKKNETKIETHTFEITIKNNKKQSVSMELKDQYPVSKVKEIEVDLKEDGDASVNAETGMLTWKISLAPGESKKVRFQYLVKYPKDKAIVETR